MQPRSINAASTLSKPQGFVPIAPNRGRTSVASPQVEAMNISKQQYYDALINTSDGSPNGIWLAQMLASWQAGEGALPDALGLCETDFAQLMTMRFPGQKLSPQAPSGKIVDFSRMLEKQDLETYLRRYAAAPNDESEWLIAIIVAACLGNDHLWQDLGLWSRSDLSGMLKHNFPDLAAANHRDMKWKKFLYKQLCEAEGLYVCRAPSCDVCQDFSNCFGDET